MSKIVWDDSKSVPLTGVADVAAVLLEARGLSQAEQRAFLQPKYPDDLMDPSLLPDMAKAVKRVSQALKANQQIVIYGDYDIDGLSATALLYDFFTSVGANVATFIPDRFEQGYGLHASSLLELQKLGAELVITVDCGTTAQEALAAAHKHKLDVIVTDHHTPPAELPTGAVAIVNPKCGTDDKLFTELAGVGVAFALVRAILAAQPKLLPEGHEKWLLDLVALGTVCDVVPLVHDNRTLTLYGLKVLQRTRRVGLQALARVAGVEIAELSESDLGFRLGPRMNAAGRLEHAQKALELLTTTDQDKAEQLAIELDELNGTRQQMTETIFDEANQAAKKYRKDPILVLSSPDWSHGVVGIVASRLGEKWHKPVILLQELEGKAKGSARSFNTFNIIDAITACGELLTQYGGHAFAAGMSLPLDQIEAFRYRLNQYATREMDVENNFKTLKLLGNYEQVLPELGTLVQLAQLAPYGNSNPEPLFSGSYVVERLRFVGKSGNHLQLRLRSKGGKMVGAIAFSALGKWPWLSEAQTAEFAFRVQKNVWQNVESVQLEIVDARPQD